jgi:serine/threonine protein kinase
VTTGSFAAGLVGVVLDGRYRLDALLGEGGMGSVFRAQHLAMDRRVAVKLLKPHLTQDGTASARFLREARATMKVDSPHVVKIFDFGITPHGDYYMALEYLDGRTVQRELDVDGPFAPARVLHIARQVLHGLGAAHRMGLVHRDLKPDNILLLKVGDDADYTKLLDFGVAKLMEGTAVSSQSALQLTQAGMVFGTPEFMSPEQACGHPLDGRSDLYSLAATMFAMLTGCAMFEGKSPIELLTHHVRTPPPHLEILQPDLAQYPKLDELLQKCLSKKREDRPATAEEMDQQIAQLQTYVKRGGAAAASSNRALRTPSQMSSSAYFQALPPELVEPGATLLPAQPSRASSPTMEPPSSSGVHETRGANALGAHASGIRAPMGTDAVPVASRGRGAILAVIALAVLATIAVAIVLVTRKKDTNGSKVVATSGSSANGSNTNGSNTDGSNPTTDAGESVRPPDSTAIAPSQFPVDAGVAALPIDAGTRTTRDPKPTLKTNDPDGPTSKPNEHLRNAEAALRDGNRLRQLAEADLALKADPKNARAKYLLADALIKGGDTDRGCSMLRSLGRNTLATTRAKAANCP